MEKVAVWNGAELDVVEVENPFKDLRKTLDGVYLTRIPESYIKVSRLFSKLNSVGIEILVDEDGLFRSNQSITFKSSEFYIVGDIGFLSIDGDDYKGLSPAQVEVLKDSFSSYLN